MKYRLKWSKNAVFRLEELYNYALQNSENSAVNIYNDILDATEVLCLFPNIAPIEKYLKNCVEQYRSLVIKRRFKIVYFVKKQ